MGYRGNTHIFGCGLYLGDNYTLAMSGAQCSPILWCALLSLHTKLPH